MLCSAAVQAFSTRPKGPINALKFDDGQVAKLSRGDYSQVYDGGTLKCDAWNVLYGLTAELYHSSGIDIG